MKFYLTRESWYVVGGVGHTGKIVTGSVVESFTTAASETDTCCRPCLSHYATVWSPPPRGAVSRAFMH